jgi:hypothetical protein
MLALLCFVVAVLASPFKSKSRLEAENAALRQQLIILRRKVPGRVLWVPKTSSVLIGQPNRLNVSGDGRAALLLPEPVGCAIQVEEPA